MLASLPASSLAPHDLGLESRSRLLALTLLQQRVRAKALSQFPPGREPYIQKWGARGKCGQEWSVVKVKGQLMLSLCLGTPSVNDWTRPMNEMQTPHLFTASLCRGVANSKISILLDLLRLRSDHRPWEMTLVGVGLPRNTLEFLSREWKKTVPRSRPSSSHSGMPEA